MNDKINTLKGIKEELVEIQRYCLAKKIGKNKYVSYKISYIDTVIEYLYKGVNLMHLGKTDGKISYYDENGSKLYVNRLIEDINNKDMQRFVNKICKIAFTSYYQRVAFQESPMRRDVINDEAIKNVGKTMYDDIMHFVKFINGVNPRDDGCDD